MPRKLERPRSRIQVGTHIVTPYTAYLVTEPGNIVVRPGRTPFNVVFDAVAGAKSVDVDHAGAGRLHREKKRPASGRGAVAASQSAKALRLAESEVVSAMVPAWADEEGTINEPKLVERVGTRTFYRIDDRWIDAAYDETEDTKNVELFSEAYFKLAREHPELARCFALGERVVVMVDGIAYETVPPSVEE